MCPRNRGNFSPRVGECHEDGEVFDLDVSHVPEALAVLGRVSDGIDDYRETFYGEGDDDEELEFSETTADAEDIRRDLFSGVLEIYGRLPF